MQLELNSGQETLVISYAQYVIELFELDVPQRIGSTSGNKAGGPYIVRSVPFIGKGPARCAPKVYDNVQDLLDYIFRAAFMEASRTCAPEEHQAEAARLLEVLHKSAASSMRAIAAFTQRCTLSHDDLTDADVTIDERTGEVSGIIDWEYHSVVPRAMAARYPSWLRHDGVYDPKYAVNGKWWLSSRDESAEMLALFEKVGLAPSKI